MNLPPHIDTHTLGGQFTDTFDRPHLSVHDLDKHLVGTVYHLTETHTYIFVYTHTHSLTLGSQHTQND